MARKPITFLGDRITTIDDAFDSLGLDCPQLEGRRLTEWAEDERKSLEQERPSITRGYTWLDNNFNLAFFLFDFGMSFMADRDIYLKNPAQVAKTPKKSFQNVLLELDSACRKKYHPELYSS